ATSSKRSGCSISASSCSGVYATNVSRGVSSSVASCGIVARVLPRLNDVAFVPLVVMNPDLRAVIDPNRGAFDLPEEFLGRGLRVRLRGADARKQGQPLLGCGSHEGLGMHLLRQRFHRLDPRAPPLRLVLLERLREAAVEERRHPGGA